MPRIKMKVSTPGSEDGSTINLYSKGQEYDVPHELALTFITHMHVADQVFVRKDPEPTEKAVIEVAPEIKDHPEPAKLTEEEVEAKSGESLEENKKTDDYETDDSEDLKPPEWPEGTERVNEADVEAKHEAKTTRVFQLADELNAHYKEILKIAKKLGISVKVAQGGLTESEVAQIKTKFKK